MQPSKNCILLIQKFEGCKLTAYLPTPHDVPTIGWGSTGKDIHLGMVWTMSQAYIRCVTDIDRFAVAVNAMVAGHPTTQNQFDALVSFAYNEGAQALRTSFILANHIKGNFTIASTYFSHYTKQAGVVLGGLVERRKEEVALYLTP